MLTKQVKKIFLIFLALLFLPTVAMSAHSNSITRAIELVKEFRVEADKNLKNLLPPELLKKYEENSLKKSKDAVSKLDSLNWTDRPGKRRLKVVNSVVDESITGLIDSVVELKKELTLKERSEIARVVRKLKRLREKIMAEIGEAAGEVASEDKRRKPVPIIDSSPHEKGPEAEGGGIWQR